MGWFTAFAFLVGKRNGTGIGLCKPQTLQKPVTVPLPTWAIYQMAVATLTSLLMPAQYYALKKATGRGK